MKLDNPNVKKDLWYLVIGSAIALLVLFLLQSFDSYSKEKRLENQKKIVEIAFVEKNIDNFFNGLSELLKMGSIDYGPHFSASNFCDQFIKKEDILQCIKSSRGFYILDTDTLTRYTESVGDAFLLSLLNDKVISVDDIDKVAVRLNADEKNSYSELKKYYESEHKKLKAETQRKTYLKVEGQVLGRLRFNNGLESNNGVQQAVAIIKYKEKNIGVLYTIIDRDYINFAKSFKDTYEERTQIENKLMRQLRQSPQEWPYFSGLVHKEEYTGSTSQNEYDLFSICYEGSEEECAQYCTSDDICSDKESRSSQSARERLNFLAEIFKKFHIMS
ncbi:hypothetical protein L2744_15260 [Shewanella profunda]|uniref:hypothetical protein n=1 Tax=Shewanella profunda TaxID=254793 RepID=UPI0020108AFC|nr:hypothetical protein [Shewanella profunda]MCL1090933.1 hypothetical protein [Shewanella profunda]